MNHDNIINSIPRVYVDKQKSARTGNDYYQLVIQFSDGYVYKAFLNDDQLRCVTNAVKESIRSNSPLDSELDNN